MNLTKTFWPNGWNPSNDKINGDPDALIRMDNLQQEQIGGLSLVRGSKAIASFSDVVTDMLSKSFQGKDYIWAGLNNGRAVREVGIDGSVRFANDILSNGGTRPVLETGFGFLYAASGVKRVKFDGTTSFKLGLEKPTTKPTVYGSSANAVNLAPAGFGGEWTLEEGHDLTDTTDLKGTANTDSTTFRGVIYDQFDNPADLLNLNTQASSDPSVDTFIVAIQLSDASLFTSIRVELLLDDDGKNYYWYEWDVATSTEIRQGIDQWSQITTKRGQFNRQGDDISLDWKVVKKIRLIFNANADTWFQWDSPRFIGGISGQLYGSYQYAYRWTRDMGSYVAKSPLSPPSDIVTIINGSGFVQPPAPTDTSPESGLQFGAIEVYRRSVPSTEQYFDSLQNSFTELPDLLDTWYQVLVINDISGGANVQDTMSDNDALELNIQASEFFQSLQDITEPFVSMIGEYNERSLYVTADQIFLSERLNPDCFDDRYTIKVSAQAIDINLWLEVVSNAQLVLGTTQDLYEISGTLLDLPDGTADIFVRAIGEAYPPLSSDRSKVDGAIFYVAADGIRATTGSNTSLISEYLSQLFQGIDCHGIPAIAITSGGIQRYPIAIGNRKMYVSLPHTDGVRRLHIYDNAKKTWRLEQQNVTGICSTQTDNIVLAYGSQLVWKEYENSYISEVPTPIFLRTVFDANGQPRNRKDTFTLKLLVNTGGVPVSIYLAKDDGPYQYIKDISTDTLKYIYINLKDYTLGFRYSLQITGGALLQFDLREYTIEYLPRPEQVNYLRIPNSNLGSAARKRFISYPLTIDTLGNTVKFTPIIDNVLQTHQSSFFTTDQKQTVIHYFITETYGTDIAGILETEDGTPFEFSEPVLSEAVSEVQPPSAEFLLIPPSNFGSPNRKRATSIKFVMNTRGHDVTFTPIVDGVSYAPGVYNSGVDERKTFEYYFPVALGDFTWFDLGGSFSGSNPFEFSGSLIPQDLQIFPPRLKSLYLPETNYGAPARKRLRTLPIEINTNGYDVEYQPIVDGVYLTPTILNSAKKKTLYHFFKTDVFGIDIAGFLSGGNPFEFYDMPTPIGVEVLPPPKKYDQVFLRFDKIGKLFTLRIRLVQVGNTTSIPLEIYSDDETLPEYDSSPSYSTNFPVTPNVDAIYEVKLPKSINGTLMRVVLGPTENEFHRFDIQARVQLSGMETDAKWIPIK